jgi:hypothetical protein
MRQRCCASDCRQASAVLLFSVCVGVEVATCSPATLVSARDAVARPPLRSGWPEAEVRSTCIPRYTMKYGGVGDTPAESQDGTSKRQLLPSSVSSDSCAQDSTHNLLWSSQERKKVHRSESACSDGSCIEERSRGAKRGTTSAWSTVRLAHRSRTRLAAPLKRSEECGWCKRPCAGSWLMGFDLLHCSQACVRATEESVGGADKDFDPTNHILEEWFLA